MSETEIIWDIWLNSSVTSPTPKLCRQGTLPFLLRVWGEKR